MDKSSLNKGFLYLQIYVLLAFRNDAFGEKGNIAKGTTDPRVEFISQTTPNISSKILIKLQLQNLA